MLDDLALSSERKHSSVDCCHLLTVSTIGDHVFQHLAHPSASPRAEVVSEVRSENDVFLVGTRHHVIPCKTQLCAETARGCEMILAKKEHMLQPWLYTYLEALYFHLWTRLFRRKIQEPFIGQKSHQCPCHHHRARITWHNVGNSLEKALAALVLEIHRLLVKLARNVNEQSKGGQSPQPAHRWL